MERKQRKLHIEKAVMASLLAVQLAGPAANLAVKLFSDPRVATALIYLETGRVVRLGGEQTPEIESLPPETDPPPPETTTPSKQPITLDTRDVSLVETSNFTGYNPDVEALLATPLSWDLTEGGPAVLIVHTHATESYAGISGYRTEDANYNMLRVGLEIQNFLHLKLRK